MSPIATPSGTKFIRTDYGYDDFGRNNTVTDNAGHVTRIFFDSAGRQQYVVENYTNFDPTSSTTIANTVGGGTNNDQDSATGYVYNAAGLLTDQVAYDVAFPLDWNSQPVRTVTTQDTRYIYAMDLANASGISPVADGSLLAYTIYPDSNDGLYWGAITGTDHVSATYNADGSVATSTDQRGVILRYGYDALGRLTMDAVMSIGQTGQHVDGTIRRIDRAYNTRGQLETVTSYAFTNSWGQDPVHDAVAIANQDAWAYDAWGNVAQTWQSHDGAVSTGSAGTTPYVLYAYDDGAGKRGHVHLFLKPSRKVLQGVG